MISQKICLLGAPAVGKTSLARRFVFSTFSDKYHSTIGVKIDKKSIVVDDMDVNLIIWDVQGEDRYQKVLGAYLKGSAACILVVDVMRPETAEIAMSLMDQIVTKNGPIPYCLMLNKCDLGPSTEMRSLLSPLIDNAVDTIDTSAKTGDGVDDAFLALACALMPEQKTG
jgi:small GTP-binding protein